MKRIIRIFALLACCFVLAVPAQAQLFKLGVKGGVNLSELDFTGGYKGNKDNATGFFIGPMAEVTIPVAGLGVDASLLYSKRGKGEFKESGIDIPLNLKYTLGLGSLLGVFVTAGPDFYFNLRDVGDALNISKRSTQVGINLGAGLKLFGHVQVAAVYNIPTKSAYRYLDGGNEVKVKNRTWQVSLAYLF